MHDESVDFELSSRLIVRGIRFSNLLLLEKQRSHKPQCIIDLRTSDPREGVSVPYFRHLPVVGRLWSKLVPVRSRFASWFLRLVREQTRYVPDRERYLPGQEGTVSRSVPSPTDGTVVAIPQFGSLHDRYEHHHIQDSDQSGWCVSVCGSPDRKSCAPSPYNGRLRLPST
jgi:hypothetical protein